MPVWGLVGGCAGARGTAGVRGLALVASVRWWGAHLLGAARRFHGRLARRVAAGLSPTYRLDARQPTRPQPHTHRGAAPPRNLSECPPHDQVVAVVAAAVVVSGAERNAGEPRMRCRCREQQRQVLVTEKPQPATLRGWPPTKPDEQTRGACSSLFGNISTDLKIVQECWRMRVQFCHVVPCPKVHETLRVFAYEAACFVCRGNGKSAHALRSVAVSPARRASAVVVDVCASGAPIFSVLCPGCVWRVRRSSVRRGKQRWALLLWSERSGIRRDCICGDSRREGAPSLSAHAALPGVRWSVGRCGLVWRSRQARPGHCSRRGGLQVPDRSRGAEAADAAAAVTHTATQVA